MAENWTYDPTTLVGEVRLLIDDRDLSNIGETVPLEKRSAIFTDEELTVMLAANLAAPMLAAANTLRVIAGNRSLMVQSRRLGASNVDYGPLRADLLKQADALENQYRLAIGGINAPADGIAEVAWTDFNQRQIVTETMLRRGA